MSGGPKFKRTKTEKSMRALSAYVFSSSLLALSAALLRKTWETQRHGAEQRVRRGVQAYERGENFSVCWSSEKTVSSGKQMQASRAEQRRGEERQMGMVRKSGKDEETFADWK